MLLDTDKVIARTDGAIGWIVFNNPKRHNALSLAMWHAIGTCLEHFQNDPEVRVVIMKGAGGKAFISGADITEFGDKRNSVTQKAEYARVSGHGTEWLVKFEKPLLAMIQGYCIGGGLAVALQADVRFATGDSTFGIPAAKLGLGYEYPGIATLCALVGPSTTKDLLFSARFLDGHEAHAKGLINFLEDADALETAVLEYANRIAANAPLTIRAAKAATNAYHRGTRADTAAVDALVDACFESADYQEGQRAFAEKRPPKFTGA